MTKKASHKLPPIIKVVIVGVISLIFTLLALLAFIYYDRQPRDLGAQMEYIGKNDFGCYGVCSTLPGSRLFFATGMTKGGVKSYFQDVQYVESERPLRGTGSSYAYEYLTFRTSGASFTLSYYDDKQGVINAFDLPNTSKGFVISMTDESYHIARRHLPDSK